MLQSLGMKILICTDGEENAEKALIFGGQFAEELQADVSVLYVRPKESGMDRIHLTTARKKLTEWDLEIPGVAILKKAQEILTGLGLTRILPSGEVEMRHTFREGIYGATEIHFIGKHGENVRLRLREGDATEEILEESEIGLYDLIITGSRGHKGITRYIIGSTALRVAEHSKCSVLIAKNIRQDDSFLMCTDGSPLAEKAEIFAAKIAQALSAKVTVLSIADESVPVEKATERARRAEMILSQMGLKPQVKVREGSPFEVIIDEAKDHDIVVMGASSASPVRRFFLGSVPLKVIEYGECPVLIVREKTQGTENDV